MIMSGTYAPTSLRKGQMFIPLDIAAQCCARAASDCFRPIADIKPHSKGQPLPNRTRTLSLATLAHVPERVLIPLREWITARLE